MAATLRKRMSTNYSGLLLLLAIPRPRFLARLHMRRGYGISKKEKT